MKLKAWSEIKEGSALEPLNATQILEVSGAGIVDKIVDKIKKTYRKYTQPRRRF